MPLLSQFRLAYCHAERSAAESKHLKTLNWDKFLSHGMGFRERGIMKIQQDWIEQKLAEQRRLYDLYAKRLEPEHTGEFVAISLDGEILLDRRLGDLLKQAIDTFGPDNFAMARIGHEAMAEWLHVG